MRRARRADVRLTRRADARSTSAPDGAPELLLPTTYYVLPKRTTCTRLDLDQIRCGDFGMTPTASRWGPGVWHLPGAQQENIQREIRPSLTPDTRRSTIPPPQKDLVQIRCRARGRTPPARPSRPPQVMPRWVRCVQPEFSAHAGSHRSRARPRPSPLTVRTRLGRLCIQRAPCMAAVPRSAVSGRGGPPSTWPRPPGSPWLSRCRWCSW